MEKKRINPVPPIQRSGPVRKDGVFSFEKKEKPKRDIELWNDIWRKEMSKYERTGLANDDSRDLGDSLRYLMDTVNYRKDL